MSLTLILCSYSVIGLNSDPKRFAIRIGKICQNSVQICQIRPREGLPIRGRDFGYACHNAHPLPRRTCGSGHRSQVHGHDGWDMGGSGPPPPDYRVVGRDVPWPDMAPKADAASTGGPDQDGEPPW